MKGFIEVTSTGGEVVLLNVQHIKFMIETGDSCCIFMTTDDKPIANICESYGTVKHRIEEAMR